MLGKKDVKVLLSDLRVYDEINLLTNQMTLAETKELFKYARLYYKLNNKLNLKDLLGSTNLSDGAYQ